jgi:hypothetical protein
MKHNQRSASPGELACPHLSDHPTRLAKRDSNPHHGRSVPIPVPIAPSSLPRDVAMSPCPSRPLVVRFAETIAEILLRLAETSQQTLRQVLRLPTTYINFAGKNALKSKKLRQLRLGPNIDSRSCLISSPVARAARTEDQDEGVLSFDIPLARPARTFLLSNVHESPDFLRDFENFYFRFNSRSATENRTEKNLRQAEKKLRFSVQTETFSPLPTTYVKKCENKKIGIAAHTVDSRSAYPFEKNLTLSLQPSVIRLASAFHLSSQRRHFAMSLRRCLPQVDLRTRSISSPWRRR